MKFSAMLAAVIALTSLAGGVGHADAACAPSNFGGEWRSYGHDLLNTRSQPDEHVLDTAKAGTLAPKYFLTTSGAGMSGGFATTPAIADGCVYLASLGGHVAAFNADDGQLVWRTKLDIPTSGYGGRIVGSPAVADGHVYIAANENGDPDTGRGPAIVSLSQSTGQIEWWTVIDSLTNAYINASPVVFNGMVFAGISGAESSPRARGGFVILDAKTGDTIVKRYTINDEEYAQGFGGASIWSTAAVDTNAGYAYVGSGNPASKKLEHPFTNALLKIDINRSRPTFGKIVAAFQGNADAYSKTVSNQPACDLLGDNPSLQYSDIWSAPCGQLDLDFGASPNLFRTAEGRLLVGDLQKSGVYHVADATDMTDVFDLPVGGPCFACNAASPSTNGDKIFVAAVPPGQVVGIDGSQGLYQWASPTNDGLHYQPVSNANGVVYVVDGLGAFHAIDAATGVLLQRRAMSDDAGGASTSGVASSAGIAIARNKIYALAAGVMVVYG
jgi:outer membrane protein assembly factor BamB